MGKDIVKRHKGGLLSKLELPADVQSQATMRALLGLGAKKIPGVGVLFEMVEAVDAELREEKIETLLTSFQARIGSAEKAKERFKRLLGTREGVLLTKKIVQIVDKGDVNAEWIGLLGNALHNLSESDLQKYFEEILYTLSQVDRLTVQGLIILSRYPDWKGVKLSGTSTTSRHTTSGDWDIQVVRYFMRDKMPLDIPVEMRMTHTFRDLLSAGMIVLRDERITTEMIGEEVRQLIA